MRASFFSIARLSDIILSRGILEWKRSSASLAALFRTSWCLSDAWLPARSSEGTRQGKPHAFMNTASFTKKRSLFTVYSSLGLFFLVET